jgi:phosphatidylserine/phosphatidylglycerophosphate/cardiolipin synthase-like enzyme
MLNNSLRLLIFFIFLTTLSANKMYFMPDDGKKAIKDITSSISKAKNNINIAIYSFTNKKIAKSLKKAAKRNININIIFDSYALKGKSKLKYLAKYQNINIYTLKGKRKQTKKANKWYGKMHSKYIIIDNKKLFFGSANYSYSAFNASYETLYANEDIKLIKQFSKNFKKMLKVAKKY